MSEAGRRADGQTGSNSGESDSTLLSAIAFPSDDLAARLPGRPPARCNRCNFPVLSKPWGCKNPCSNCGTVYPLGDCSD